MLESMEKIQMINISIKVDNEPYAAVSIDGNKIRLSTQKNKWYWQTRVPVDMIPSPLMRIIGILSSIPDVQLKAMHNATTPKLPPNFTKKAQ